MPNKMTAKLSDADNPEWTERDFATAQYGEDVSDELAALFPSASHPKDGPRVVRTSIPLSPEVIDHFKAEGDDWRKRINEALLAVIEK